MKLTEIMHFKKSGWIYFPVSFIGWVVTITYLAVCTWTLISIGRNYDSLRSSLIRFFPYFISFTVVLFWIASNTTGKSGKVDK